MKTECIGSVKSLFYLVTGLEFHLGMKSLTCDTDFDAFVQCGIYNDYVSHVYASNSEFELNESTTGQILGVNDDSGSELDDDYYNIYDYCSSAESDTASIDHLSNGKEEVLEALKEGWIEGCRRVIGLDGFFLKTICKGELLSAVEHRQCARHIYANFRKKFTGVQFKNLFWKAAKATYPAKFEKVMTEIKDISKEAHKHLMERNPESWSRAYLRTYRACDAVENRISKCFNSLIVETRRKPIINMLEDIRIGLMERMQRMREKHGKWIDVICPCKETVILLLIKLFHGIGYS
ncbi:hypothetical protein Tco_0010937 [Tanacetum coccineum]